MLNIVEQITTIATTDAKMPQQTQPNAITNANKGKNNCKEMQSFASQMHQTYVEFNAETYVYPIFWDQTPLFWDKVYI